MKFRTIIKTFVMAIMVVSICIATMACNARHDDHQWSESTKIVGTSVKCTETARICSVCDAKEVISSTQHDYSYTPPQPVNRDGEWIGYSQTYTCKVCGHWYTRLLTTEEIADAKLTPVEELLHVWTEQEEESTADKYKAWLAQEGKTEEPLAEGHVAKYYKVTRVCSHCDKTETAVIRRTEHSYGEWKVTKDARCDINGVKIRNCTKCGAEQRDIVPPKGHTWDEGQMNTVPTTYGDIGVCRYTCTTCGQTKQINGSHT